MRFCVFIFLVATINAYASCPSVTYKDDNIFIMMTEYSCSGYIYYAPVVSGEIKAESSKSIDFDDECKISYVENKDYGTYDAFLSCKVESDNPLSGATYQRLQKGECSSAITPDYLLKRYVYSCIEGCKGAPRELPIDNECSE